MLLNDLIYKIKEAFNKEFESVFQKKLQELAKIRERNTRIKQINADLDDTSPVWEPDLTEKEKPQLLFEVKDNEVSNDVIVRFRIIFVRFQIKVERYYTPEQLKQLEEQRLNEERRREQEKLDNWRERGLTDMMGGVLQVRREDELKKVRDPVEARDGRHRALRLGNSQATVRLGKTWRRMDRTRETSLSTILAKSERTARRTGQVKKGDLS